MRQLPLTDPGTPDLRSPGRFLLRVLALQRLSILGGALFGILWMGSQALLPYVVGRAIDDGVAARDTDELVGWCVVLGVDGLLQGAAGLMRHRFAVTNFLVATFRTQQWLVRHSAHRGAALPAQLSTGDVVSVGTTDTLAVARSMDITARLSGAVVSFVLVAVLLLTASLPLGLVVVLGVPAFGLVLGPLLRPLHARQAEQRRVVGDLTSLGADTVAGLRVLRGIGGEDAFVRRYRAESQRVRAAGVRVARSQSLLDATQVLVPGTFVALVTWLGARYAVEGEISAGELVAFYGYSAFLLTPLRTLTEAVDKVTRAFVGARRTPTASCCWTVDASPRKGRTRSCSATPGATGTSSCGAAHEHRPAGRAQRRGPRVRPFPPAPPPAGDRADPAAVTSSPPSPAWPDRRCSGTSSSRCSRAPPARPWAGWPCCWPPSSCCRRCSPAGRTGSRWCSRSGCSPACARSSWSGSSTCRCRPWRARARATCSPA